MDVHGPHRHPDELMSRLAAASPSSTNAVTPGAVASARTPARRSAQGRGVVGGLEAHGVLADDRLEAAGVSSATMRPWSMMAIRSAYSASSM